MLSSDSDNDAQKSVPVAQRSSKTHKYKEGKLDLRKLAQQAAEQLGTKPFDWQLQAAQHIYQGEDIVVDVGTGCSKLLCFILPILLHEQDIVTVISPLSALMIDQVSSVDIMHAVNLPPILNRQKHLIYLQ